MERLLFAVVNDEIILRLKVNDQGHLEQTCEKWFELHKTNAKTITGPFYSHHIHCTSGNA